MVTESPQAAPTPATTARVLVVEDDPTVAEVVVRYLEREGYEVDAVCRRPGRPRGRSARRPISSCST